MKKSRISKKLELSKETLRKLTPKDLERVRGGAEIEAWGPTGENGCAE